MFFGLVQSPAEIRQAVVQSLPDDETLEMFIDSARIGLFRHAIATTEKHLVIYKRGWFWRRYDFFAWKNLKSVCLEETLRRASLVVDTPSRGKITIENLSREIGRQLNGCARKYIAKTETKTVAVGKPCPFCSEPVKVTATVCPHCRRDLPVR